MRHSRRGRTTTRLRDFQAHLVASELPGTMRRKSNELLFSLSEAVRLWLKEENVRAPFHKLVVEIDLDSARPRGITRVSVVLGICFVIVLVRESTIRERAGDVSWWAGLVASGLARIGTSTGWRHEGVVARVRACRGARPILAHRFARFRRRYRGVTCDLWFEGDVGHYAVCARFSGPGIGPCSVRVREQVEPVWLEFDFPVASTCVTGGEYLVRDRRKRVLARVPVPTG